MLAVDDERVDGDLRVAEHERQRIEAEDGEPDRDLAVGPPPAASDPADGEDDETAVAGSSEQPAEAGARRRPGAVCAGEDVLGVRVGAVLADQREHGGQVVGTRGARRRRGTANRFLTQEPSPGRWVETAPLSSRDHGDAPHGHALLTSTACRGKVTGQREDDGTATTTGLGSLPQPSAREVE